MIVLQTDELLRLLRARYPFAFIRPMEASYNVISDESFDSFRTEFANHMVSVCGNQWYEFYDCNRFAFEAYTYSARKHYVARLNGHGVAQGVAFGTLSFLQDPFDYSSGHCINWRVRPDLTIREFEPQTRRDLTLTPAQCASAWHLVV